MSKFKFRFESVLNVKDILEKKIQEEILLIEKEIQEYKDKRQIVIDEREKTRRDMTSISLKASNYQSSKIYDSNLEKVIQSLERKIVQLYEKKKEKMNELVERKKEHKIFEMLKENDNQNFQIEERRSELKELNEIAIRNYHGEIK
jgi:flagellar export protein FliJ